MKIYGYTLNPSKYISYPFQPKWQKVSLIVGSIALACITGLVAYWIYLSNQRKKGSDGGSSGSSKPTPSSSPMGRKSSSKPSLKSTTPFPTPPPQLGSEKREGAGTTSSQITKQTSSIPSAVVDLPLGAGTSSPFRSFEPGVKSKSSSTSMSDGGSSGSSMPAPPSSPTGREDGSEPFPTPPPQFGSEKAEGADTPSSQTTTQTSLTSSTVAKPLPGAGASSSFQPFELTIRSRGSSAFTISIDNPNLTVWQFTQNACRELFDENDLFSSLFVKGFARGGITFNSPENLNKTVVEVCNNPSSRIISLTFYKILQEPELLSACCQYLEVKKERILRFYSGIEPTLSPEEKLKGFLERVFSDCDRIINQQIEKPADYAQDLFNLKRALDDIRVASSSDYKNSWIEKYFALLLGKVEKALSTYDKSVIALCDLCS